MMTRLLATTAVPGPNPNPLGQILRPLSSGLWQTATSSPLAMLAFVFLALLVVVRVYRAFRWMPLTAGGRDPMRRYAGADRAAVLSRAGTRCEHDGLLSGRCNVTENLQADHIHPHSKGGSTTVGNGQALCSRHNRVKAARIPFNWELRRLERRRATYSPRGISLAVVRRSSREPQAPTRTRYR